MVCELAIEGVGNHYIWQMKFFTVDLSHNLPLCRPHATDQKSTPFTTTTLYSLWKKLASKCLIGQWLCYPASANLPNERPIHPWWCYLSHKRSICPWLCTQEQMNKCQFVQQAPYLSHMHVVCPGELSGGCTLGKQYIGHIPCHTTLKFYTPLGICSGGIVTKLFRWHDNNCIQTGSYLLYSFIMVSSSYSKLRCMLINYSLSFDTS